MTIAQITQKKKPKKLLGMLNLLNTKLSREKNFQMNWSGKVWALKQGVDLVIKKKFSHFIFIDADIILKEKVIVKAINFMNDKKLSMLSLMAKLKCMTFWEYLLIPSFIYFFQKLYPFSKVNNHKENLCCCCWRIYYVQSRTI